jgi:GNAT superfamily N-acetyltransferase
VELRTARGDEELKKIYGVIRELRTELSWDEFVFLFQRSREADQYTLVGVWEGEECIGAMGFRILFDFLRGKHLYIDDLIVTEVYRSHGLGAQLLQFAEKVAFESGCKKLRLCTGVENESGKRFYERQGWSLRAVAYTKDTSPPTFLTVDPTAYA